MPLQYKKVVLRELVCVKSRRPHKKMKLLTYYRFLTTNLAGSEVVKTKSLHSDYISSEVVTVKSLRSDFIPKR